MFANPAPLPALDAHGALEPLSAEPHWFRTREACHPPETGVLPMSRRFSPPPPGGRHAGIAGRLDFAAGRSCPMGRVMDALTLALRALGPWLVPVMRDGRLHRLAVYDGEWARELGRLDSQMLLDVALGRRERIDA